MWHNVENKASAGFTALTQLVGWQKRHSVCKNLSSDFQRFSCRKVYTRTGLTRDKQV